MAKSLPTAIQQEIAKDENQPIHLVTINLDEVTLRYTDYDTDVTFGGNLYTAKGMSFDPASYSLSLEVDEVELHLDNVQRDMSSLLETYEFQGRWCTIQKTFANLLDNSENVITLFSGRMYHPRVNEQEFVITVRSLLSTLNKEIPTRLYQKFCQWEFGGTECGLNITVSPYKETGTAGAGSTSLKLVDPARTEEENWWKYGVLKMTSGANSGYRREILSSAPGEVRLLVAFPNPIAEGDSYEIQTGCKKTFAECSNKYSNDDNFGGFLTVSREVARK